MRLMVVHRCPAVPTQAKTQALRARSKSASSIIIAALFPPSSRMLLPNLLATSTPIWRPTAVEPVKEIKGRRLSLTIVWPTSTPPAQRVCTLLKPNLSKTSLIIFYTATAQRLVVGAGFQIMRSPQMKAIAAFQPATATGKLKAVIHPIKPRGFHCSIIK